jgi:hypothetical protein
MTAISEIGNKYARLQVLERLPTKDKKAMWKCICDCGNKKAVSGTHLRSGHVKSCGCYHSEVVALIGKNNKGKSCGRGKPRKYEDYVGVLGKVVGVTDKSEKNGAVQYLVECAKCGEIHKRNAKHLKNGQESQECKEYRPPNYSGLEKWDGIIRRVYGITYAEYEAMLEAQGGGCAICGQTPEQEGRRLPIDHCHTTNKVRGVLCTKCNQALGMMDDDTNRLAKAIQYLQKSYS